MTHIRWTIGIDVSTQTVTAMLIGVAEADGSPSELVVSGAWTASRPCRTEAARKSPSTWVRLARECVSDLLAQASEAELVESVGVSTTFPGVFVILRDGTIDPRFVSLYDSTDDAGICSGEREGELGRAEEDTLNRMWPGNMAVGAAHLIRSEGLKLEDAAAVVPPNTAFAYSLLRSAGRQPEPGALFSDFTQTAISGLYDARTGAGVPGSVAELLRAGVAGLDVDCLRDLLPGMEPAWRSVVPEHAIAAVRDHLGLPLLNAVSIGAGDSPLGSLALYSDRDTIINVRGSSDSPMIVVDSPKPRRTRRETVLHYPLPTARSLEDSPWCVVAPMLRSGRVWDWVRALRFPEGGASADAQLEELAKAALKRRLTAPAESLGAAPLVFAPALGGERAPEWDSRATGFIKGLIESHDIGDLALAALEGVSIALGRCLSLMETRYQVRPAKLLLAGGPTRNKLWNWVTQVFTRKQTFATTFSDASLLGAAMLGYGAAYGHTEDDGAVGRRLFALSEVASGHPLISPAPVGPPDADLAALEQVYVRLADSMLLSAARKLPGLPAAP